MMTVYLSMAAVLLTAAAFGVYARARRPVPAAAEPDVLGEPWPHDEAAELLAAWRDQTTG